MWELPSRRRPLHDNLARYVGTLPAVLNAANEVAIEAFLNGQLTIPGIWQTVERVMTAHQVIAHPTLEALIEADSWARREAKREG